MLPDAEQAFLAPGGALALVVVPNAIRVYRVTAGLPGDMLLEFPRPTTPERDVVMVQWALGRSVNRWAQMLEKVR